MVFEPIAIVGQGCVLPGALNPDELWRLIREKRSALSPTNQDDWRIGAHADTTRLAREAVGRVGGYVRGFERVFRDDGFLIPAEEIRPLDSLFHFALHAAREALVDAGVPIDDTPKRGGVVLGNLSYPNASLARFAEDVWTRGESDVDPRNRFTSGLPAHLVARAIGFQERSFALDAACASSLYALRLACDMLHDRRTDVMLAGGVCHVDDLILHLGFTALQAISKSGRSRPFHRDADGLVPAHGAALVVLKRLDDAERDGDHVRGVIRAVGLANDGRSRGLLVPSKEGQIRAMRAAYEMSGLSPHDVSLVECHATGTVTGDAVELASMREVFAGCTDVPIGSIKSNLGHPITASGAAALLKVLAAMKAGVRPATLHVDEPTNALADTPLRLVHDEEPWDARDGRARLAAISNFGFGGNNAHMLVEAVIPRASEANPGICCPGRLASPAPTIVIPSAARNLLFTPASEIAIVAQAVFAGTAESASISHFALPVDELRLPPNDLSQTLPQQLLLLRAALDAKETIARAVPERTMFLAGMQCDAEVARNGAAWRVPLRESGGVARGCEPLSAATVLGCMPNVVANRVSQLLDVRGPSFTIASEEASGTVALEVAMRALRRRDVDLAVVGAVDLCCEPVHIHAAATLGGDGHEAPGDAAVLLVLKRLEDAQRDGDDIIAMVGDEEDARANSIVIPSEATAVIPSEARDLLFRPVGVSRGHAHAASGLLAVSEAALAVRHGARLGTDGTPVPWLPEAGQRVAAVDVAALGGQSTRTIVRSAASAIDVAEVSARLSPPAAGDRPTGRTVMIETHWPPPIPAREVVHATAHEDDTSSRHHEERSDEGSAFPDDAILMPLPPALPSVRFDPPTVAPVPFVPPAAIPSSHALTADVSTIERIAAHNAAIAEVHRAYLRELSESHTRAMALAAAPRSWLQRANAPSPLNRYEPPVESPAVGPRLDRDGLIEHARGKISSVFGPMFERQDGYARQVRMPEPPLLLADRVTRLEGVAGGMGTGVVVTETDVTANAWYLHEGRMPAGIMVEAGQADLLLISWLGADFENRNERVYRLLGCDLRSFGELPKPGDTLEYEIHVDGHAKQGDVRLFFFHYDCRKNGQLVMSVRNGQAGFFTDEELAQSSGVLWSADDETPSPDARVDGPIAQCTRGDLSTADVTAFAEGRVFDCFGRGFERATSHTRTPTIPAGRMRLLDDVAVIDPRGGPWRRGYLRARLALRPDHWFFDGHFKNDPCMPGTLMLEGCLEAMAIFMTSLGFTLERDGWRFEPVPETQYSLRCRGQATPSSKEVVYEIFVDEVIAGPIPTLYADVLGLVDGLKAFHCHRLGLRLVPAWPLDEGRIALDRPRGQGRGRVARVNGFAFDEQSLMACALGRPTSAFGDLYRAFDGARRVARLPGPPYHFISRITDVEGPIGGMREGSRVAAEYDVPPDAWYFTENGAPVMPFCVLMEAALQPCGWLASFVGCALQSKDDLVFRNLDGNGVVLGQVGPDAGTLTSEVTLTSLSIAGPLVLVAFDVTVSCREARLFELKTSFGFFPADSMNAQTGLPTTDDDRRRLSTESPPIPPLRDQPRLATGKLALIDRVTGLWPHGGSAELGRIRAEMDVRPDAWFFRAHFFQDPVQPGSLGVEAMLAAFQILVRERSDAVALEAPASGRRIEWKYRGQVVPENRVVVVDMEITEFGSNGDVVGRGSLWVDGLRIYEVDELSTHSSRSGRSSSFDAGGAR